MITSVALATMVENSRIQNCLALNHPALRETELIKGIALPKWAGLHVYRSRSERVYEINDTELSEILREKNPPLNPVLIFHWSDLFNQGLLLESQFHLLKTFIDPKLIADQPHFISWKSLTTDQKSWVVEKDFSLTEWESMRGLGENFLFWIKIWIETRATRQEVREMLGILRDLTPEEQLRVTRGTEKPAGLIQELQKIRYPQATEKNRQWQQKVKSISWPKQGSVQWVQRGDLTGLDLKLFVTHPDQISKWQNSIEDFFK